MSDSPGSPHAASTSPGPPSADAARDALAAVLARAPYHRFLGLSAEVIGGSLVVVLPAADRHIGDIERRSVHGGVLAAVMEAAAGAVLAAAADGQPVAPVDFASDFLRAAAIVDTRCTVTVVRRGRRFAHVRVDAWQHDPERPVAVGHGTFAVG